MTLQDEERNLTGITWLGTDASCEDQEQLIQRPVLSY